MATGVVTWTHVYCGHADPSAVWIYMVRRPSPHSTGGHIVVVTIGMHSYWGRGGGRYKYGSMYAYLHSQTYASTHAYTCTQSHIYMKVERMFCLYKTCMLLDFRIPSAIIFSA